MKKRIITTIIAAMAAAISAFAQDDDIRKIDFDYNRSFDIDYLWIDYNQNGKNEKDEMYVTTGTCTADIDYMDFRTAGNMLTLDITIDGEDKTLTISARLEDISFVRSEDGESVLYIATNKLKETQFSVSYCPGETALLVMNPAILKIRK